MSAAASSPPRPWLQHGIAALAALALLWLVFNLWVAGQHG